MSVRSLTPFLGHLGWSKDVFRAVKPPFSVLGRCTPEAPSVHFGVLLP